MKILLYFLAYLNFLCFGMVIYLIGSTDAAPTLSYFNAIATPLVGAWCFYLARTA